MAVAITVAMGGRAISASLTASNWAATTSVDASCQSAAMDVSFVTALNASAPGYRITQLRLDNVSTSCEGSNVLMRMTANNGTTIYGEGSATLPAGSTAFIPLTTPYQLPDNTWPVVRVTLAVIS